MLACGWTLFAAAVQAVFLALPGWGKAWWARVYWRGVARIIGLRLTVSGRRAKGRPVLFVANHCSYLDIVALGSVLPGCFVAKGEIAGWPGFGVIAKLGRSIFVSRDRKTMGQEQKTLEARLAEGDNVILFPEGTTSDGNRVRPFASSFFTLAFSQARPQVQPVTLVYDRMDGLPVRRGDRPEIAWYGDMDLAPHYLVLGRRRTMRARIVLGEPVPPGAYPNRKLLAAAMEEEIAVTAAAVRQGRL